jgi:hypothetical protein
MIWSSLSKHWEMENVFNKISSLLIEAYEIRSKTDLHVLLALACISSNDLSFYEAILHDLVKLPDPLWLVKTFVGDIPPTPIPILQVIELGFVTFNLQINLCVCKNLSKWQSYLDELRKYFCECGLDMNGLTDQYTLNVSDVIREFSQNGQIPPSLVEACMFRGTFSIKYLIFSYLVSEKLFAKIASHESAC